MSKEVVQWSFFKHSRIISRKFMCFYYLVYVWVITFLKLKQGNSKWVSNALQNQSLLICTRPLTTNHQRTQHKASSPKKTLFKNWKGTLSIWILGETVTATIVELSLPNSMLSPATRTRVYSFLESGVHASNRLSCRRKNFRFVPHVQTTRPVFHSTFPVQRSRFRRTHRHVVASFVSRLPR